MHHGRTTPYRRLRDSLEVVLHSATGGEMGDGARVDFFAIGYHVVDDKGALSLAFHLLPLPSTRTSPSVGRSLHTHDWRLGLQGSCSKIYLRAATTDERRARKKEDERARSRHGP
jgi:hypothetical protein